MPASREHLYIIQSQPCIEQQKAGGIVMNANFPAISRTVIGCHHNLSTASLLVTEISNNRSNFAPSYTS
jgi:hypothetical protein